MSQSSKPMPNLDQHQQSTRVLNLTVLQRIDPFVEEILITAAHVTFYEFNIELNQWSRKDVEGSLFVVKRNTQPRFQFIVMNRRNTDNLVEDLLGDFEFEVQVPYLLYRNAAQEVNGIWFYNKQDCEAVATLFTRINNAFSKVHSKPIVASAKSSEFEELEAVPSLSVIEGPLEPPVSSAAKPVEGDSFTNFFSAAVNVGNPSNATNAALEPSATISSSSQTSGIAPFSVPSLETTLSLPKSTPPMPLLNTHEPSGASGNHTTNLVKPSFFSPPSSGLLTLPPVSTSMPTAPPLHPPVTMQRPYGAPLLQPFPPPAPSPSLTPVQTYGPIITRDKVRDALLRLVQDNNFIDMVYWEMLNAHNS